MAILGTDALEVPAIYKAYVRPKFQGISPQNMDLYGTVPPFQDPEIPIEYGWEEHVTVDAMGLSRRAGSNPIQQTENCG